MNQPTPARAEGIHASGGREATFLPSHSVQFYEDDSAFLDSLSEFMGGALGSGGACLLIATPMHRIGVSQRLAEWGIDLRQATGSHRFITMDAAATLSRFMVQDWPDRELFRQVIEPELVRAQAKPMSRGSSVVAFGEMVALLWAEGKREAAVHLEQLWNEMSRLYRFSLRCAYPLGCFGTQEGAQSEAHKAWFEQVCAAHSKVIPAESFTSLGSEDERMRMVSSLQQQAQNLQAALDERVHEVEQRRLTEEKLRRSEEFAKNIVESSIDCVKVLDLAGRLEYMSPLGQKALEIEDIGPHLGRNWVEFWKQEDRPKAEAALAAARSGRVGSFHGDCLTASGAEKSWDVKITAARGPNGEIERLIAISRDITELRQAQKAAMQAEKLAAAGRLAATIAHEINNPLEAVTNFIFLAMTSKGIPEDVYKHLEIADRELARVAQIAQQTLGFYKDNSKHRWVWVAELIRDVMLIYERKLKYKNLETVVSVDAELKVYSKAGELKQAVSNLVANAIDASNHGGKLWLRAQPAKNWTNGMEDGIRVTLADNGTGMTPEVKQRIFVPFFTTKTDVGTGIGLWVTKCLVEQQGGYMRFRSRQGEKSGTVMSFYVPRSGPKHQQPAEQSQ